MRKHLFTLWTIGALAAAGCAGVSGGATLSPSGTAGSKGAAGIGSAGTSGPGMGGGAGAAGAAGTGASTAGAGGTCSVAGGCAPRCGDGNLDGAIGEVCDDGNTKSGDGCSGDCKTIEKDYACPTPGKPCTYLVKCGDGVRGGIEQCDPPNVGHGCSADCRLEPGYVCNPPPTPAAPSQPSTCHKTVCGDGTKEGAEACDDHNAIDGDGCSSTCALEPDCSTGTCTSQCGDGMKLAPEACDDGNTVDGDGCSHDCQLEAGFSCADSTMSPPPQLNLAVTYRDFISIPIGTAARHPDFEAAFAGEDVTPLLVKTTLDANGKPVMDGRCGQGNVLAAQCPYGQQVTTAANFNQWYRDVSGVNLDIAGTLLLPQQGSGSYVFDSGNRGLFPVDTKGWTSMSPPMEGTSVANADVNDGRSHDFGFSTEVRYFFQYKGGESLTFSGDDDLWIFVNRRLALDLGGLHHRIEKSLSVDQSATTLGLAVGGLYEIALFHAERHTDASNFKLTLTGFAPTTSSCRSACGDGVKAANEQCDDGNNRDGDGCSHDCHVEIIVN
jgi:fibro-slime domain-containing protein